MDLKTRISEAFEKKFGKIQAIAHAPGRINLIGDHTDYNLGFVLPAAIDLGITMAVSKNNKNFCRIYALDVDDEIVISLNESFQPLDKGWANYIIGVLEGLKQIGVNLEGFDAVFGGNIPLGSGMSSSAALECVTTFAVSGLLGLSIKEKEVIQISRDAEQQFAGVKCGIMDQFASVMGKEGHAIKLDCRNLHFEYLPLQIKGAAFVLIDTCISHSLRDSNYNRRRQECEEGVSIIRKSYPEVNSLRDVNKEMLSTLTLPEKILKRCLFVIEENERVVNAGICLKSGLGVELGDLMYQSHDGLSNKYEVSCPELDHLVAKTRKLEPVLGARMMGGGFGGCTINLMLEEGMVDSIEKLRFTYKNTFGIEPKIYKIKPASGARIISLN